MSFDLSINNSGSTSTEKHVVGLLPQKEYEAKIKYISMLTEKVHQREDYSKNMLKLYMEKHLVDKHNIAVLQKELQELKEKQTAVLDKIGTGTLNSKTESDGQMNIPHQRIDFLNHFAEHLAMNLKDEVRENERKESVLTTKQARLKEVNTENKRLEKEFYDLEKRYQAQELSHRDATATPHPIKKETASQEETAQMNATLQEKDLMIKNLQNQLKILKENDEKHKTQDKEALEAKLSKKSAKIKSLKKKLADFQRHPSHEEYEATIHRLNNEIRSEKGQFKLLEQEMTDLKKYSTDQTKQLNEKTRNLNKRKGKIEELERTNERLSKKARTIEELYKLAEDQQKFIVENHQKIIAEHESTITKLKDEMEELEFNQSEAKEEITSLTEENNSLKDKIDAGKDLAQELAQIFNLDR